MEASTQQEKSWENEKLGYRNLKTGSDRNDLLPQSAQRNSSIQQRSDLPLQEPAQF